MRMPTGAKKMQRSILFLLLSSLHFGAAVLQVGFYNKTCPRAELIVREVVQERFNADQSVTAALLRMQFHDCFVRGCDASILIDSTSDNASEKEAGPNQTVREFDLIDEIKSRLEVACPSNVSCADIIVLATRDSVVLAGGPNYAAQTGRRDGLVSNVSDVDVPDPTFTVAQSFQAFSSKGFTLDEMVILLGGHTIGVSHCSFFEDRITDFQGTGSPDPTMNRTLVSTLQKICRENSASNSDPTAFLDQRTPLLVDNQFYNDILSGNGILQIDQELALDKSTSTIVSSLARNASGFRQSFGDAMVKLGAVQVLVGNAGQIRKSCRAFNPVSTPPPPPIKNNATVPPPPPPIKESTTAIQPPPSPPPPININAPVSPPPVKKSTPASLPPSPTKSHAPVSPPPPPIKSHVPVSPPPTKNHAPVPLPSPPIKSHVPVSPPPTKNHAPISPPEMKEKLKKNEDTKKNRKMKKKKSEKHRGH